MTIVWGEQEIDRGALHCFHFLSCEWLLSGVISYLFHGKLGSAFEGNQMWFGSNPSGIRHLFSASTVKVASAMQQVNEAAVLRGFIDLLIHLFTSLSPSSCLSALYCF